MVPLKSKSASALVAAFTSIFKQRRKPERLQTDAGTEFMNRSFQTFLRNRDVRHFVTYNETKAQIVERFNRTLKHLLWRLFTMSSSFYCLDKLDNLVNKSFNQSIHRSIKMKPAYVTVFNAQDVWRTLYVKQASIIRYKFKVGDQVKISKYKRVFQKGYLPSWTKESFTMAQRLPRNPPVYRLKEAGGKLIRGTFYEAELQKVTESSDHLFRIEKNFKTSRKRRQ